MSTLSERPDDPVVGVPLPHESAALHVTGEALYTDDLVPRTRDCPARLAGPVPAHARPDHRAATSQPAYAVPGVVRVLTAADVPGVNDAGVKHDEPLFPGEAMFHGHAVCWVLGETLEAARLGAAAVEVDYEPLPSLVSVRDAIDGRAASRAPPRTWSAATPRRPSPRPSTSSRGEFEFAGQEHFYLETHASLALVDEGGQVFVQSSTQHPTETQEIVAHVLGVPSHEVTVQCLRMGGGFGGKEMQPHGFAAIAALGATLTGRPVRLRLNRTQDMTMSGQAARLPRLVAGRLRRRRAPGRAGRDAHRRRRLEPGPVRAGAGPRDVPHRQRLLDPQPARRRPDRQDQQDVADRVPRLRRTAGDARDRGHPRPVRTAARHRRRPSCVAATSTRPGQDTPYGQAVRHADRLEACWSRCSPTATSPGGRPRSSGSTPTHPDASRGLAMTPVKFGISFNLTAFNQAGALVHVYKDGSVLINHGGTEMGQGLHTKMLQVAATALGVPLDRVRLAPTRTDKVPNTSATAASSGADLNGAAIKNACEQIRSARSAARTGRDGDTALDRGRSSCTRPTSSASSSGRPASTGPRGCTGTRPRCAARRSSTSRTASPPPRSRSTASPAPTRCAGSTSSTTSATACRR